MNISWSIHLCHVAKPYFNLVDQLKLLSRCLFFKYSPIILVNRGFVLKSAPHSKMVGDEGRQRALSFFLMIPTEKGEAGNVCKDNENGKKRYNRINRSNSKIACS